MEEAGEDTPKSQKIHSMTVTQIPTKIRAGEKVLDYLWQKFEIARVQWDDILMKIFMDGVLILENGILFWDVSVSSPAPPAMNQK